MKWNAGMTTKISGGASENVYAVDDTPSKNIIDFVDLSEGELFKILFFLKSWTSLEEIPNF